LILGEAKLNKVYECVIILDLISITINWFYVFFNSLVERKSNFTTQSSDYGVVQYIRRLQSPTKIGKSINCSLYRNDII
jgi:hypothetical protein